MKKAETKNEAKEEDMKKDNNINNDDIIELKDNENEIINVINKEDKDVCKNEEKIKRKKINLKIMIFLSFFIT